MDLLTKLLDYYHLNNDDYAYLTRRESEIALYDVSLIPDIKKIVDRVHKAIETNEKIIVYGDYDCDGICSTSIVKATFDKLNYPISYYIPSRYLDGYGLNVKNVEKIAKQGFKLIITVDNGICANEAIDKANEYGIDVIVIDHHELPETKVNAIGIIHPIYSNISSIVGSGGYMSLFFSRALLGKYDDYLVTLAGLSTISDLMELKGYNRDVVRLALSNLEKHRREYYALSLLMDSNIITEKSFSLEIAPKINAVGRLIEDTTVNRLVKFLTSTNKQEVRDIGLWISQINEERKQLTKDAVENLPSFVDRDGICIKTDLKEGLIGLIANRLLNQYRVPSIVFTLDENDKTILKGSIRSKEGFNVTKAFASLDKYLLTGGGHALAGGLSIKASDFDGFKNEFLFLCHEHKIVEDNKGYIEINCQDITRNNYDLIRTFSPFGMGFAEPSFIIKNMPTRGLTFISQGKHLSTSLSINSKLLGFNIDEHEFKANSNVNLYGNFNLSEYRGYITVEFRIEKYQKN